MSKKMFKIVSGTVLGGALCFSSTVASAATSPRAQPIAAPMSISPFVALSAYGTMQSRSAVCASAVGVAAAAVAAGQPAPGCVLPALDPVVPAVAEAPIAVPVEVVPVAAGGFGLGIGALLAGLVAVAAIAGLVLSGNGDDDEVLPISPD